jgi:hypothetical protein
MPEEPERGQTQSTTGAPRPAARAFRAALLAFTLLFVLGALAASSAFVVYAAYVHDLSDGVFAVFFAVLSAQVGINWLRWKTDGPDRKD